MGGILCWQSDKMEAAIWNELEAGQFKDMVAGCEIKGELMRVEISQEVS